MAEWLKNRERNETIRQLRSEGFSIPAIAKRLNCSKSTVSYYSSKVKLNDKQLKQLKKNSANTTEFATKANQLAWQRKREAVQNQARKEWPKIKSDPKVMGFLGLYWGEGQKRVSSGHNTSVSLVNTDPGIILVGLEFFREHASKTPVATVRYYKDNNPEELKTYWETLLGLDVQMSPKTGTGNGGKQRHSTHGICTIRFGDWELWHKIMTWIGLWRNEYLICENVV